MPFFSVRQRVLPSFIACWLTVVCSTVQAVDVQILRLRRKVESSNSAPALLKTKRGAGYFLDADVQILV